MTRKTAPIPENIKSRLRGSSQLRVTVSDIRQTINPARYPALIAWLPMVRHAGRGVFSGQFPSYVTRLKRDWPFDEIPPENEILWATELLKYHASKINSFLARKYEYERSVLTEDYSDSCGYLDSMERDFGVSLWSVENKIALLQAAYGLERQKGYVNEIRGARISNPLAVIAFYSSERNEPATNPVHFKTQMAERAEKWQVAQEYKDYLLFRIAGVCDVSIDTCAAILRYEATSAIVDYYDSYVRLGQSAMVQASLPPPLLAGFTALADTINDPRICKILLLNQPDKCSKLVLRRQQLRSFDYLVKENYEDAIDATESSLRTDATDVALRFIAAQSKAELGLENAEGSSLGDRIEKLCSLLITKNEDTEDAYLEMFRLMSTFHLTSFSGQLSKFLNEQCSNHPCPSSEDTLMAFLQSPYLDVRDLAWLPKRVIDPYSKLLFDEYGLTAGSAVEFWRSGAELDGFDQFSAEGTFGLGKSTVLEIKIHKELASDHIEAALSLAQELEQSSSRYTRRRAARCIAHCLLKLHHNAEAIEFVAARTVSDPATVFMLPIHDCAERLDKPARKLLAAKLSTPIVLDLFARHVSDRLDNIRGYAYEDFLIANGIERPSDLVKIADRFEKKLLIYYLNKICVPRIMEVSSTFLGSQDLDQERLAICSILRQIDKPNTKQYESEIRDITRKQVIQLGVLHVNKSRIFVDLGAIRRWAERNLKEGFTRYRDLLAAGVDTGVTAFAEALEEAIEEGNVARAVLMLPKNEANDLLADLVSKIFVQCMTDPEHGLDCYLSMRIRHGSLSGQLRGPLEEQKIITQREGISRQYKSNELWLQKLEYQTSAAYQVDVRLAQFSRDYDSAIDEFAREFIQVHSVEKESGLFSRAVPEIFLGAISEEVKQDTSFDDFVEICFKWFWQRVEVDLKTVRMQIDGQLKPKINLLFVALQSDLALLLHDTPIAELDRAIHTAQTGAQNALNQVNEWFRLREPESAPSLPLEEIIMIGLRCVENIHPDFRPLIIQDIPTMPALLHWTPLSDIFFIVFENIQKHSGMIRPAVEITVSEGHDQVRIMVKSEIDVSVDRLEAETKVAKIKLAISEGSYQRGARSEGGTGLMKLRKIIGQSVKKSIHLDFGFTDDNRFFVELELPYMEIPT